MNGCTHKPDWWYLLSPPVWYFMLLGLMLVFLMCQLFWCSWVLLFGFAICLSLISRLFCGIRTVSLSPLPIGLSFKSVTHDTQKKEWKILNWNVRGLKSNKKWNSVRYKIIESKSKIICLQETKKENFDLSFIKIFCPLAFDSFHFLPSIGASRGILVAQRSHTFSGSLVFSNSFALLVEFTSMLNNDSWLLTTIYAPCTHTGKREFLEWFRDIDMPPEVDWIVVGDFNLLRRPEGKNREGADPNEMFLFNEAISNLSLIKLPLHARHYTWTNKQFPPLLERIDQFFTSNSWTSKICPYLNGILETLFLTNQFQC